MKVELYRHFNSNDVLLYVGVSRSAYRRYKKHKTRSHWVNDVTKITIERFDNQLDAYAAERRAILDESPLHNATPRPGSSFSGNGKKMGRPRKFDPTPEQAERIQAIMAMEGVTAQYKRERASAIMGRKIEYHLLQYWMKTQREAGK